MSKGRGRWRQMQGGQDTRAAYYIRTFRALVGPCDEPIFELGELLVKNMEGIVVPTWTV